jgi:RNA polymerase sigma-70 factor, ECF subfamily
MRDAPSLRARTVTGHEYYCGYRRRNCAEIPCQHRLLACSVTWISGSAGLCGYTLGHTEHCAVCPLIRAFSAIMIRELRMKHLWPEREGRAISLTVGIPVEFTECKGLSMEAPVALQTAREQKKLKTLAASSDAPDPSYVMKESSANAMDARRGEVTTLLDQLRAGQADAESRLLSRVYAELKRLARSHLRRERSDHTLGATDLVHEAYIRMGGVRSDWQSRAHFFRVAAQAMRRILVDHARAHSARKRGGGQRNAELEEGLVAAAGNFEYLLEVDEALQRLSAIDPRQARVVELRFFAELSVEEIARALECSERTIRREWRIARAWLRRELSKEDDLCGSNAGSE